MTRRRLYPTTPWSGLLAALMLSVVACSKGGGNGAAGHSGSSAAGAGGGGGADHFDGGTNEPEFEGIDLTQVTVGKPPAGCVGGFDPTAKSLTLTLSADVRMLWLAVVNGTITANGVGCTAADGTPATPGQTSLLKVDGSSADETVILDLLTGSFDPMVLDSDKGIVLNLGAGNNAFFLRGTDSNDTIVAGTVNGTAAIDLSGQGQATVSVAGVTSLTVSLGPGNDAFYGMGINGGTALALPVVVYGGAGNDMLQGGIGDDVLHGGSGNDIFRTAAYPDGADTFDGGDDLDEVDYSKRTAPLTLSIDGVANDGEANEHDNILLTVEGVVGGSGDDIITGSPNDDVLYGGPGNDIIHGGAGNDIIHGGDGDDQLYGDAGEDYLYADAGNDAMFGGDDDDVLVGGSGSCRFDGGGGDGNICVLNMPTEIPVRCQLY